MSSERATDSSMPAIDAELAPTGDANDARHFQIAWRLRGNDGDFHVDADLVITEVDDERSQLAASVEWHQESGVLNADSANRHARKIVRSLLRELARDIEDSVVAR
jgi:hypothetical protein